jgi:hypothetical protein
MRLLLHLSQSGIDVHAGADVNRKVLCHPVPIQKPVPVIQEDVDP